MTDVSARLRVRRGVSEALLVRGRAPRVVWPGRRMRIRVVAQPRRGGRRPLLVTRVPRGLRPGRRTLVVGPTSSPSQEEVLLELLEGAFARGGLGLAEEDPIEMTEEDPADQPVIRTLGGLAVRIAGIRTRQGLNARFSGSERRFVLRSDTRFRGRISVPLRVARQR